MKRTKYKSKKIEACPICWKEKTGDWGCGCGKNIYPGELPGVIVFDSRHEHQTGLNLKMLEKSGKTTNLKHHEVFELLPMLYYCKKEGTIIFLGMPEVHIKIPHSFTKYESDFTFIQNGVKKVIEVKSLTKKLVTRTITDAKTGKKIKHKVKISYPFFTREQPESKFRTKCQLMKAIHKVDVEIWAGNLVFRFDEKWKLREV